MPRFVQANRDALVRNLAHLTRERHTKYAGTFYHLEPNIKETPGGLRDYQLLCWLEQLHGTDSSRLATADPAPELQQPSGTWRGCAASFTSVRGGTTTC